MTIDFETINDELIEEATQLTIPQAEKALKQVIVLEPFIEAAEEFEVIDRDSAKQCLSMSLQARKMRQNLDKTRAEIVRPHYDFQKAVNKLAKSFETKLQEIEDNLVKKMTDWMKNNQENQLVDLMTQNLKVDDGSMSKKMKWTYEIEDSNEIPREFLCIDEKKIQLAIKNGIRVIKGVKIYEKLEIDMRVKN